MKKKNINNPLMSDGKKIKNINVLSDEDGNEIRNFIILVVVIGLVVGILYFVTAKFNNNDGKYIPAVQKGEINYNLVTVGTLLNRPYNDYYVLVYDADKPEAVKYSTLMAMYKEKEDEKDYKKIYFCNLDNNLNKAYYNVDGDNKSNPKAKSVEEFDFGDITLLEIKNGKIVSYIEDYTKIQELLK